MLSNLAPTRSAGQQNVIEDPEKEHNPTSFMRQLPPGPDSRLWPRAPELPGSKRGTLRYEV